MRIETLVMAEGLAQDAEGIYSLVRVGQEVLWAQEFPVSTKRAFLSLLADDEEGMGAEGQSFEITFAFMDPTGEALVAQTFGLEVGDKRYPELPGASWVPLELVLTVYRYGTHVLQATLRQGVDVLNSKSVKIHVVPPPQRPA